jgi:hypothetical protein
MATSRTSVFSVKKIINSLTGVDEKQDIKIPVFQRGVVWNTNSRQKLVDSILKGYPIGSILLWKMPDKVNDKIQYALIDGLQRSTSLQKYQENPGLHLQKDWLTSTQWYSSFKQTFPEIENFDQVFLPWIKEGDNFTSLSAHRINRFLNGLIEDANLVLERGEQVELFVRDLKSNFSLLNYKIPAIIYDGPKSELGEIFTRINKEGRPLSSLQIIAASWIDASILLDLEEQINLSIAEKCKERLLLFENDNYEIIGFDEEDPLTYCSDLFQYLFGLGKVLISSANNIFQITDAKDPDTIAFYILGICNKLPVSRLNELPDILGDNPDLSGFANAAKDSIEIVSTWFRWLTDLNLNSQNMDSKFYPHSLNQMISIVSRVLLEKYDPETWEMRDNWEELEEKLKLTIRKKYLMDILSGYWQGSGDNKMFQSCWNVIEHEGERGTEYTLSTEYTGEYSKDLIQGILDAWYNTQMNGKQKKRASPNAAQKLAMKYVYSSIITVNENANTLFEIEHINSVAHMKTKIQESDSEGWPMNSIANLMLLKRDINRDKGEHSVKEYLAGEIDEESRNHIQRYLISEVQQIPSQDVLTEETYIQYCQNRWPHIRDKILQYLGYDNGVLEADGINVLEEEEQLIPPEVYPEIDELDELFESGPSRIQGLSSDDGQMALAQSIHSSVVVEIDERTYSEYSDYISEFSTIDLTKKDLLIKSTPKISDDLTIESSRILSNHFGKELTNTNKRSRTKYLSDDNSVGCTIHASKKAKDKGYWFGIQEQQIKWHISNNCKDNYFVFVCASVELMFVVPFENIVSILDKLSSRTIRDDTLLYWHVHIKNSENGWEIFTKKGYGNLNISSYWFQQ